MNRSRQSAAKGPEMTDQGSTTIPRKGSTDENLEIANSINYNFNTILPRISCIYKIYCTSNKKSYIGSCIDLKARITRHKWYLKNNKHHSKKFQNTYNKYGENSFVIQILEESIKDLKIKEEHWIKTIDSFKNGLNGTDICVSYKSYKLTEEQINKRKLSCSKPVICLDMLGNYICKYNSVSEAAKSINDQSTNISSCCKGNHGYIKDLIFVYESDYDKNKDYAYKGRKYKVTQEHRNNLSKSLKGKKRNSIKNKDQ